MAERILNDLEISSDLAIITEEARLTLIQEAQQAYDLVKYLPSLPSEAVRAIRLALAGAESKGRIEALHSVADGTLPMEATEMSLLLEDRSKSLAYQDQVRQLTSTLLADRSIINASRARRQDRRMSNG